MTQAPIGSGYDEHTTAEEVLAGLDLSGRLALVTGGYSGIGIETTRALARAGARVVVVNAQPTPYDALADLVVREPIGTVLPGLLAR